MFPKNSFLRTSTHETCQTFVQLGSHLSNSSFFSTQVNRVTATWWPATSDVLQGSVLRPLLLSIFINNLGKGIKCTFHQFVDDTKVSVTVDLPEGWSELAREGSSFLLALVGDEMAAGHWMAVSLSLEEIRRGISRIDGLRSVVCNLARAALASWYSPCNSTDLGKND